MSTPQIETDYLIIGSGTVGLAFADTLIAETDAHVTIVDRHGKPGGHWNDAYPFVTLHQPSAFYGVNSLDLGSGLKDSVGLNKGLYELASGPEVSGYFDRVMNQRLLPSSRVRYLPLCNHLGQGRVESLLTGVQTQVTVRRKTVDSTFFSPKVPLTQRPRYAVDAGVRLVPPNALPGLWQQVQDGSPAPRHFVVVGGGKTAMDACIWLVQTGADPESIQWVVPRDSWLVNRVTTQNGPEFFGEAIGGQADQMEAFAKATSVDDLFLRLEACGAMVRIDPSRRPGMFHFATVSLAEVEVLRRIRHVVRLGHVQALHADRMVLERGSAIVAPGTLFIDCTASAVEHRKPEAAFQGDRIVPQLLRAPLVSFSAAMTAYVEAHYDDEAHKNRLCAAVPFPHTLDGYPLTIMANMRNQFQWSQDKALREWMRASRLDGFGKLMASADKQDAEKQATLARLKENTLAAAANLPRLVASAAPG
jgi:NAD(P)-binding Rossmann-like domain